MISIDKIIQHNINKFICENTLPTLTAYHGTPHDFIKFQTKNIGTGEGNQSFGYGLYFTSNKDVATFYAKLLGKNHGNVYTVKINGGEFFEWNKPLDDTFKKMFVSKMNEEGINQMPIKRLLGKNGIETKYASIEEAINFFPNGKFFYENLSLMLNGDKNASNFLAKLGFIGITYPIGQFFQKGGKFYGDNFVIFDENNIEIINKEII